MNEQLIEELKDYLFSINPDALDGPLSELERLFPDIPVQLRSKVKQLLFRAVAEQALNRVVALATGQATQ